MFRVSLAPALLAIVPLLPSLWVLPSILTPGAGGKAMAQAWFDRALETPYGERMLTTKGYPTLKVAAEAYTVYLDPKACKVEYWSSVTNSEYGLLEFQVLGYDIVILGSGMFHRFYQNPDVYAEQVAVYDAFFEKVPDRYAFEGPPDPLLFAEGNGQVYVFFLSERARVFRAEMENIQRQLNYGTIKWVNPEQLHLTLRFFGDTEEKELKWMPEVIKNTTEQQHSFSLSLSSLGVFKNVAQPRVIWIGCSCPAELSDLKTSIDQAFDKHHFPADNKPFSPHLTLGRIKALYEKARLAELIRRYQEQILYKQQVDRIVLYESILKKAGPEYFPLHTFNLS